MSAESPAAAGGESVPRVGAVDQGGGTEGPGGSRFAALGDGPQVPPGGRRRRAKGGRHRQVIVRVTDGELAVLRSRAASAGVSVPRLLAESALGPPGSTVSERRAVMVTLLAARRTLAGAANNLNQVSRWSNIHEDAHDDVDAAVAAVSAAAAVFESRVDDVAAAARGRQPDAPAVPTEALREVVE